MPVAVNCCVLPIGMFADVGVTAMELKTMPVPDRLIVCVDPVTFPLLSVMVICALLCAPAEVGINVTSITQLLPFPSVVGEMGQG